MATQNFYTVRRGLSTGAVYWPDVGFRGCRCDKCPPRTVVGVFTLFMYAAIISLRTDLFLFCFPEQSNKGRVLISPGPSYYFFQVNTIKRSHKSKRVQVEREVGTILSQKVTDRKLALTAKRCYVNQYVLLV